jgi:hypothetical protein
VKSLELACSVGIVQPCYRAVGVPGEPRPVAWRLLFSVGSSYAARGKSSLDSVTYRPDGIFSSESRWFKP